MSQEELRKDIQELRSALDSIDAKVAQPGSEGLRSLGVAVDKVRRNAWAVLCTEHRDDYQSFLGRIRVRRATETCLDVLADVSPKSRAPNAPGVDVFHATLRELAKQCEAATGATDE